MKIYTNFDTVLHESLKGNFKTIAKRYDVSSNYVSMISTSDRELKSKKSITIYIDLLLLAKVLQPSSYDSYLQNLPAANLRIIIQNSESIHLDYLVQQTKK